MTHQTDYAAVVEDLQLDAKAFRENTVYTADGRPIRLGVNADRMDAGADAIQSLIARNAELTEELAIWKSVFPDIAPERVLPDRAALEARNAELEADNARLRDALETIHDPDQLLCCTGYHCGCQGATVGRYAAWVMQFRAALESKETE